VNRVVNWFQSVLVVVVIVVLVVILVLAVSWEPLRLILTALFAVLMYVITKGFLDAGFHLRGVLAEALRSPPPQKIEETRETMWANHFKSMRKDIIVAAVQLPRWTYGFLKVFKITPSLEDVTQLLTDLREHEDMLRNGIDNMTDAEFEKSAKRQKRIATVLGHTGFYDEKLKEMN